MNEQIKEAIEVVDILNEKYYNQTNDENIPFFFVYADWYMAIKAFDDFIILWDNNDNDCKIIDDNDSGEELSQETIMECVIRNYEEYQKRLLKFKIRK